jgi:hypothetical protein
MPSIGTGLGVERTCPGEERLDLLRPVEIAALRRRSAKAPTPPADPGGVADDQLVLDSDLEDLPKAGDRLVDRLRRQALLADLGLPGGPPLPR